MLRKTYQVQVSRDDEWWMIAIPELDGLTQARRYCDIDHMARSYIAVTLDVDKASFDIDIAVDCVGQVSGIATIVDDIARHRTQAAQLTQQATIESRELAKQLSASDVTVRDIGSIMGISYQRAQQLIAA